MANYDLQYEGPAIDSILDTGKKLEDDGYIFLGLAAANTTSGTPDKRVFYFAGPGSYSGFGVTIPTGAVGIFAYNGSAWVTSVINIGGIYDVSSANSGRTYASLSTAIEDIPSTARKAGMEIKFVNTSTSKYEVWIYQGTSTSAVDFTNTANWIGVDETPLSGSNNLVSSGGIYNAIQNAFDKLDMMDSTGTSVQSIQINVTLRKNDGTEEDPDWQTVASLVLPSATTTKAGLMSADDKAKITNTDGVFDISEYTASGGTLTQYASLSAALGTNGINVPQNIRKGGMSVKFVQSSDNKYVQYRLMDRSFTIDIAAWEKDNEAMECLLNNVNIGSNNTNSVRDIYGLIPGRKYRLTFVDNNWDISGVTETSVWKLQIIGKGSTDTAFVQRAMGASVDKYYNFVYNHDYLRVTLRATAGVAVRYTIEEIDASAFDSQIQIYNSDLKIEETKISGGSVFIHNTIWYLRCYVNTTYNSNSDLASVLGVSTATSPSGATNCIEIPNAKSLVFNGLTNLLALKDRSNVTNDDLVILACINGKVVRADQGILIGYIGDIDEKADSINDSILLAKKAQLYISDGGVPIIKSKNNNLYFKASSYNWAGRGSLNFTYSNSQLAEAMGVSLVDLSATDKGYIELASTKTFVINGTTKLPAIKDRSNILKDDIVLLACLSGQIVALNTAVFGYQYIAKQFNDIFNQLGTKIGSTESFTIAAGATTGTWRIFGFGIKKGYKVTISAEQGSQEWINYIALLNSSNGSSYGTSLGNFTLVDNTIEYVAQNDISYLGIHLTINGLKKDGNNDVIGGTVDFTFRINKVASYEELNNIEGALQFYTTDGNYPIIKKNGNNIYLKTNGNFAIRGNQNVMSNKTYSMATFATELGVELVDISESDTGYIEIPTLMTLVIDGTGKVPALKSRTDVTYKDIVLLANVGGDIVSLNTNIFGYQYINQRFLNIEEKTSLVVSPYVTENTDVLVPQIQSHQTSKSATFCFFTDLHNNSISSPYSNSNKYIKVIRHIVEGINIINKDVNIWTTVVGGDYLLNGNSTPKQIAIDSLRDLSNALRGIKEMPKLVVKGNHDDNSMGTLANMLNPETYYKTLPLAFENNEVVIDATNPSGNYGYFDIKPQKIRIVYLNSVDIPWIEEGGSTRYKGQFTCGVQQAQLDFVANALQFAEEGWSVLFVSHHCITPIQDFASSASSYIPAENGGSQLLGIIEAFKNKTTFSGTVTGDFASSVSVDYTNNASNGIICLLSGHTHADRNAVKDDMLFLATTTATQSNTGQNTDGSTYTPTENSKNEGAADFITIDKQNGIIYLDRYGFGVSRKFYYTGEDIGEIPT